MPILTQESIKKQKRARANAETTTAPIVEAVLGKAGVKLSEIPGSAEGG